MLAANRVWRIRQRLSPRAAIRVGGRSAANGFDGCAGDYRGASAAPTGEVPRLGLVNAPGAIAARGNPCRSGRSAAMGFGECTGDYRGAGAAPTGEVVGRDWDGECAGGYRGARQSEWERPLGRETV